MSEIEGRSVQAMLEQLAELRWPDVELNPYDLGGELRTALIALHEDTWGFADSCVARALTFASEPACLHGEGLERYLEGYYFEEDHPDRAEQLRQGAPLTQEERDMILDRYWHGDDCARDSPIYYLYRMPLGTPADSGISAYFVAEAHEWVHDSSLKDVFGPFRDMGAVCDALFDDPSSPLQSARGISELTVLEAKESFGDVLQCRGDAAASRALRNE